MKKPLEKRKLLAVSPEDSGKEFQLTASSSSGSLIHMEKTEVWLL